MASQLASCFDPLGISAPCFLGGKLILQRAARTKLDWDEPLPSDLVKNWNSWVTSVKSLSNVALHRYCFRDSVPPNDCDNVQYQLHGFCDASDDAFSCVIYLRRIVNDRVAVSFIFGKSRVVLSHQSNWVISRKELEAAKLCSDLMLLAKSALKSFTCSLHFWTDSQVVYKWITNPDLHLTKFVKRRVDKILLVSSSDTWRYVGTSLNPAEVGTREKSFKNPELLSLWLSGPEFLLQGDKEPKPIASFSAVRALSLSRPTLDNDEDDPLEKLIKSAPDLYSVKKRFAYLLAFKEFIIAKCIGIQFKRPKLTALYLDRALKYAVKYVQFRSFGAAIKLLRKSTPDDFETTLKRLNSKVNNSDQMRILNELKTLRNLRPCLDSESMFRVEGRLLNSALPIDTRQPFIIPSRHALTRLIILHEHVQAGHAGPAYTLMQTRQQFWIIFGNGSVRHYLSDCAKCALRKARPVRQLLSDLLSFRVTKVNKPFQICGVDFLGPLLYRHGRSECKSWGLLFSCLSTRCLHVEIVTGLDLNNFLLAFSRFINLRGSVETIYSDNCSTFCAAAKVLPKILCSVEFNNSLTGLKFHLMLLSRRCLGIDG